MKKLCADVLPVFRSLSATDEYAITLGGSHGKGLSDRSSDFDFRLYYRKRADTAQWDEAMQQLGEYIEKWKALNVEIDGVWPRSIDDVEGEIELWVSGKAQPRLYTWNVWGYQFPTDIYNQAIVEDPACIAQSWKDKLNVYPEALKKAIIEKHGNSLEYWRNDYHYMNKCNRGDHVFMSSITARLINDIMQVIYALNEFYFPGDGLNLIFTEKFDIKPVNFEDRVINILYPKVSEDYLRNQYDNTISLVCELLTIVNMQEY